MFDGDPNGWEPKPKRRRLYTVVALGQRRGKRCWQVDMLFTEGWMPIVSFYAQTKREAYATAAWVVGVFSAGS
jgi:hypothetical protein